MVSFPTSQKPTRWMLLILWLDSCSSSPSKAAGSFPSRTEAPCKITPRCFIPTSQKNTQLKWHLLFNSCFTFYLFNLFLTIQSVFDSWNYYKYRKSVFLDFYSLHVAGDPGGCMRDEKQRPDRGQTFYLLIYHFQCTEWKLSVDWIQWPFKHEETFRGDFFQWLQQIPRNEESTGLCPVAEKLKEKRVSPSPI